MHAVWGGESHVAQRDVYCLLGIKYKQRLCPDTQLHTSGLVASNGPCVLCFAVIFYGNDRCPTVSKIISGSSAATSEAQATSSGSLRS